MDKDTTLKHIEQLVEAYYNCELSRTEEAELRKILASTSVRSKKIDSCRLEMGLETAIHKSRNVKRTLPMRGWVSIAAAVALIIGLAYTFVTHNGSMSPAQSQETVIVYIAGKKVEDYTYAKKLAEKDQAENMAFMHKMINEIKLSQQNSEAELKRMREFESLMKN